MTSAEPRPPRVLVVEDDPRILRGLMAMLRAGDYAPTGVATAQEALERAALTAPDAVLLDLLLPDLHGLEVCRRLREWSDVPIVVVSAVGDESEKVAALDAGADDYVTKPYPPLELLARLRAVMRRAVAPEGEPCVAFGDVEVDLVRCEVARAGAPVALTAHEYGLLGRARPPPRPRADPPGPCYGRSGAPATAPRRTTCGSTWPACGASWRPTPAGAYLVTETGVGYRLRA